MFDGVPAHWHKAPEQTKRPADGVAYVMLAIMLASLCVPAAFLGWAILQGIAAMLP